MIALLAPPPVTNHEFVLTLDRKTKLRFFARETDESDYADAQLEFSNVAQSKIRKFRLPVGFHNPTRMISAKCKVPGKWLILGSEDWSKQVTNFCLLVELSAESIRVVFADEPNIRESRFDLSHALVRQENIGKWVLRVRSDATWNIVYKRTGKIDLKTGQIHFSAWVRKR